MKLDVDLTNLAKTPEGEYAPRRVREDFAAVAAIAGPVATSLAWYSTPSADTTEWHVVAVTEHGWLVETFLVGNLPEWTCRRFEYDEHDFQEPTEVQGHSMLHRIRDVAQVELVANRVVQPTREDDERFAQHGWELTLRSGYAFVVPHLQGLAAFREDPAAEFVQAIGERVQ